MKSTNTGYARIVLFFLLFFLIFAQAFAADGTFDTELSFGLGGDISGYSATGFSVGGLFSLDYRFLPFLSAGLKGNYGNDFDRLTNVGGQAFARFYFIQNPSPFNGMMVFAQLEGGAEWLWEKFLDVNEKNLMAFTGGLGAGVRLRLPLNFYAEAYARGGYPFIWGFSILAGYTLTFTPRPRVERPAPVEREPAPPPARPAVAETRTETPAAETPVVVEREPPVVVEQERTPPPQPAQQTRPERTPPPQSAQQTRPERPPPAQPVSTARQENNSSRQQQILSTPVASGTVITELFGNIIFRGNGSDFTDLDSTTVAENNEILDNIANFLIENPEYNLKIEGYANPVQTTARAKAVEEQRFLQPISRERARAILELLVDRGVSRNRLTAVGLGGTKTVAAINDPENWDKNRRVEFTLIK
ncbi:MAG: OmpA family protein [Spirochaetaceae bacterium]|jgi:outer membrane protein OmpA-like peptidoglycan-associated protein|nr:OmpA family protein [Spirochaetaceae bacterium]